MERTIIIKLNKDFEQAAFQQDGMEFWCARDLQNLLEYTEWRNFVQVIEKAKTACHHSKQSVGDHFVDVNKMVKLGSDSEREIDDGKQFYLTYQQRLPVIRYPLGSESSSRGFSDKIPNEHNRQIFANRYRLELPDKKTLVQELKKEMRLLGEENVSAAIKMKNQGYKE